jgi:hypothetical protein
MKTIVGMRVCAATLLAALAALFGTGCGDGKTAQISPPTPTASQAAGGPVSKDALLAVHDEFVTCVQDQDALGIAVHYSGGQAVSDREGVGGAEYDDHLSAPKSVARLTKGGTVEYVGLRADRTNRPGTPDVDVLIFASESDAATQSQAVGDEAKASPEQVGLFVSIPLHEANSKFRDASRKALAGCEARAQAQAS